MNRYSFNFQNGKSSRYLLFGFLGAIAGVSLFIASDVVKFIDSTTLGTILIILTLFVPIGTGLYFFIKHGKAKDIITTDDTGFTSKHYGRVAYADIVKIYNFGPLGAPPPSLKMRLRSGKKLAWFLTREGSKYNKPEDAEIFEGFILELSQRLEKVHGEEREELPETRGTSGIEKTTEETGVQDETPDRQIKKVIRRNNKGVWTIPLGLAFGLLALARTCGDDWFKQKDPDFIKIMQDNKELHDTYLKEAKHIVNEKLKTEGRLFLYTNDMDAKLTLLPPVRYDNPLGIPAFQYNNAVNDLRAFIRNPDSLKLPLVLITGQKNIRELKPAPWNITDSTDKAVFFRIYDPEHRIKPAYAAKEIDSSDYPVLDLTWKAPLYDTVPIAKSITRSLPGMAMMLSRIKHGSPSCKFYMAAREKDSITEGLFKQSIKVLNKQMYRVEVDTTAFVLKVQGS
ncbi:hypothetical protein [Sinomicrobium weinanense]|uniref:Uncharacterized protein n=1 Tax=Sinomicrobium weinanense TaxID=2842200 RepID=A0A926JQW3_9FLAO|nr:hypothetical protein [Sinomicrobium weinanense]MBC9795633.1 hypothetical protein [Sinomicrobium weinanense]MBU3124654.1 hypothetical protein [Sinomicrobium weinanense]